MRYPLSGASDHLVSEALYLDDPDGNGIEIYRDRPRAEWPRRAARSRWRPTRSISTASWASWSATTGRGMDIVAEQPVPEQARGPEADDHRREDDGAGEPAERVFSATSSAIRKPPTIRIGVM